MISKTSKEFCKRLAALPQFVQSHALRSYKLWKQDPTHPGLQFKKLRDSDSYYSVRIGLNYRAIGIRDNNEILWIWIGSHSDYDHFIDQL